MVARGRFGGLLGKGIVMNAVIERAPIVAMVAAYNEAMADIEHGNALIKAACSKLRAVVGTTSYCGYELSLSHRRDEVTLDQVQRIFKRDTWRTLIDRLGIEKFMSIAMRDELRDILFCDRKSKTGKTIDDFPPITEDGIESLLAGYVLSSPQFLADAIKEQFDFWSGRHWRDGYKTNREKWRISCKIVATFMVEMGYNRGCRVNYDRLKWVQGLDTVLHLLDGRGIPDEHKGNLVTSIESADSMNGVSRYFQWRAFKNRNLHLKCLRPDLVQKFNDIACDKAIPEVTGQLKLT